MEETPNSQLDSEASVTIKIASDFSLRPGARYRNEGKNSGEEFREKHLEPLFADPSDARKIVVDFDGTVGYASSFLEEAFGGLVREHGIDRCLPRFEFISEDDPYTIEVVLEYMKGAAPE